MSSGASPASPAGRSEGKRPGSPPPALPARLAYVRPPPTLPASRQIVTVPVSSESGDVVEVKKYKPSQPDDYLEYFGHSEGGAMGLQNVGNTCYFNSVMQALLHCPALIAAVSHSYLHHNPTLPLDDNRVGFLSLFVRLTRLQWEGNVAEISPMQLIQRVWNHNSFFRGFRQHDAQELLRCALDMLQEALSIPVKYYHTWNARSLPPPQAADTDKREDESGGASSQPSSPATPAPAGSGAKSAPTKSLPPPPRPPPQCVVSDLFQGELVSEVKCKDCGHISATRESFLDLSLELPPESRLSLIAAERGASAAGPIKTGMWASIQSFFGFLPPLSLETCLHSFCTGDDLSQGNQYRCDKCKKKVDAVKHISIAHLPEVLTIHIKRFHHTATSSYKLSQTVHFKETLDMQPYLHRDHPLAPGSSEMTAATGEVKANNSGIPPPSTGYDLFAVIRHSGSVSGGHYVCYAKNHVTGKWYCHDDEDTSPVSIEKVLSQEAYLLFYIRTPCLPAKRRALELIAKARAGVQEALAQEAKDLAKWYAECAQIRKNRAKVAGTKPLPGPGPCQSQLLISRIENIKQGKPTASYPRDEMSSNSPSMANTGSKTSNKKSGSRGGNGKSRSEMKSQSHITDSDEEVLAEYGVDCKTELTKEENSADDSIFPPMPPSRVRYLSRSWVRKVETLSVPVPIDNRDLCCIHGVPDGMLTTDRLIARAQAEIFGEEAPSDRSLMSPGLIFADQEADDPRAIVVTAEGFRQLVEELGALPDIHSHSHEPFLTRIPSQTRVLSRSNSEEKLALVADGAGSFGKRSNGRTDRLPIRRTNPASPRAEEKSLLQDPLLIVDDTLFVDDYDAAQSTGSGKLLSPADTSILDSHAQRLASRVEITHQPSDPASPTPNHPVSAPGSWPLTLVGPIVDGRRRHCPQCYTAVRRERDRQFIALDRNVKQLLTDNDPYFLLPSSWLAAWRKYIADGSIDLIPGPIPNEKLVATWPLPKGSSHSPNEVISPERALEEFGLKIDRAMKRNELQEFAVTEARKYPQLSSDPKALVPPPRAGLEPSQYTALSACVFRAMMQHYGGGPEIPRASLDIYDTTPIDIRFDNTTGLLRRTADGRVVSRRAWQRYLAGEIPIDQVGPETSDEEDHLESEEDEADNPEH